MSTDRTHDNVSDHDDPRVPIVEEEYDPQVAAGAVAIRALGRHIGKGDQRVVPLDIGPTLGA